MIKQAVWPLVTSIIPPTLLRIQYPQVLWFQNTCWSRRGRKHMVVGCTTIYAISTNEHYGCEYESHSSEVYSIRHYVMKFVSDLQQIGGFSGYSTLVSSTNKTDRHDMADIFLKVALNTPTLIQNTYSYPEIN